MHFREFQPFRAKNILVIAFCLFKYFPFGGLQRDFYRIAKAVEARGARIRVYVQVWQGKKPQSFEIIQVPVSSKTNHGRDKQYADWVNKHILSNPVDLVVGFNKMPGLDIYYAADVCYASKVSKEKKGLKGLVYRLTNRYKHFFSFEKEVFKKGLKNKLLMISESQINEFKKFYSTEDKRFFLLPPGISIDRKYSTQSKHQREKFRSDNDITKDQYLLLQLGSNFQLKGVDRSLKAIASLPKELKGKIKFWIVGQDNPKNLLQLAKKLGILSYVRFFSGRDDVPSLLSATDIFLHPAYYENTGTVILEALVAGVPVITTSTCGYAHYVLESNCGFVLSGANLQEDFNHYLLQLLSNENLRHTFAVNARIYSETHDLYSMIEKATDIIIEQASLNFSILQSKPTHHIADSQIPLKSNHKIFKNKY